MLIPLNASEKLQSRITAVHKASDDIRSRFTTPAKLKNFDYDDARMKTLEDGFAAMCIAERAHIFYTETQEIMHYITTAESKIPTDVALHDAFAEKKASFMDIRSRLLEDDFDTDEADDMIAELVDLKNAYIEYYMEAHKAYRLDINGAQKKGKIQESATLKALHALRGIRDILPVSQLADLTNQMAAIKVCYECTTPELQQSPDCPHCHFNPADNMAPPVSGRLEFIEDRLDDLLAAWTQQLLSALDDPMLDDQRALLGKKQREILAKFTETKHLPIPVDQQFIDAVNTLLSGMESVELPLDELHRAMASWSPCAPDEFKTRLTDWIDRHTSGHDKSKVRIVIK